MLFVIPLLLGLLVAAVCLYITGHCLFAVAILILVIGLNVWSKSFTVNISSKSGNGDFTLLTFNVNNWIEMNQDPSKIVAFCRYVQDEQVDVLAVQEIYFGESCGINQKLAEVFPYHTSDYRVFSKYPISQEKMLRLGTDNERVKAIPGFTQAVGANWEEMPIGSQVIEVNGKKLKLIDCYMMTNGFTQAKIDFGKRKGKVSAISNYWQLAVDLYRNMALGYAARLLGAELIREEIEYTDIPVIVCGDMNDLSGSPSLRKICNGTHLRDAWWEKGFGFGFTFSGKGMWFRLDHVMYSGGVELAGVKLTEKGLGVSDHRGVMVNVSPKDK